MIRVHKIKLFATTRKVHSCPVGQMLSDTAVNTFEVAIAWGKTVESSVVNTQMLTLIQFINKCNTSCLQNKQFFQNVSPCTIFLETNSTTGAWRSKYASQKCVFIRTVYGFEPWPIHCQLESKEQICRNSDQLYIYFGGIYLKMPSVESRLFVKQTILLTRTA